MRSLLLLTLAGIVVPFGLAPAQTARAQDAERPNVLLIYSDDLNVDLGCYGHDLVQTPHLDALADRGVLFERAYCQYPLCGPSRASMLTGQRPDAVKVFINEVDLRWALPDVATLPQHFQRHGYRSLRVGKVFHDNPYSRPLDDAASWDEAHGFDETAVAREMRQIIARHGRYRKAGSLDWTPSATDPAQTPDGKVAGKAIELLEENRDRPFFLAVGFFLPHTPWIVPERNLEDVDAAEVELATATDAEIASIPSLTSSHDKRYDRGLNDEQKQQAVAAYYAGIEYVDGQVGRVLEKLKSLGLEENTVVVFASDHGYQLGHHGMWHKYGLFEQTLHVPLIVADPRLPKAGTASDSVVELLDVYPTLVDLAGLPRPSSPLHGRSLRPLLENPEADENRPAYAIHQPVNKQGVVGRSVIEGDWHYFEWNGGAVYRGLFNLRTDPRELNNLAEDPAHADTVAAMRRLLAQRAEQVPPDAEALKAQATFPPDLERVRAVNSPR